MKKMKFFGRLMALGCMMLSASAVEAGGLMTNTNYHIAFDRMMARGASTEIDAAYSNPAGLAWGHEGWQLSFNVQKPFQWGDVEATVYQPYATAIGLENKLYKGDVLNVLMPEGYIEPVTVAELFDAKMQPIESCPHPEMVFYMKAVDASGATVTLPEMTFLSRDGDKDAGILPQ
jgi:hypothetical protein